jgi:predicted ATPase/class 3 adenylate cyclase
MSTLPTGTVTLLFTDIEGSTRLLQEFPDRYADILANHHRQLREAIERHGGHEVGTEGDAFFVAFRIASDAVAAAEDAQRALGKGPLRVRMGLHTGEPAVTPEGYVGIDVHRAARIAAAGHGGQVLLSGTTRALLGDSLPVRDLGEHRLKDLAEPMRLYQLGPGDFPPLRSLSTTNLPVPESPLIGRERDVIELVALLREEDVRLVTVTGPGGTGKTRFAIAAGAELLADFLNGVFFVPLGTVTDPAVVVPTIAHAIGVRERHGEPLLQTLSEHLEDKSLLLVLDNFEQVIEAAPEIAEPIRRAPRLRALVTSREPLRVGGEREFALRPLATEDAVALFVARAKAVKADFALNGDAPVAREICERLDRLPLAIELVAARVKVLPPPAILARLGQRLTLVARGRRDLPARQRTLRGAIEWSYELLDDAERNLFTQLAVFVGGWTLEAAEEVCDADLDTLASLVDKSLVRRSEDGRFSMLETIHEYASERLEASTELDGLRGMHASYFLALAEPAEEGLKGPDQLRWLRLLETEQDNFRAALAWALPSDGSAERARLGLRIVNALGRFWYVHADAIEGCDWFERALAANPNQEGEAHAKALHFLGVLNDERGDLAKATALFEQAAALRRRSGNRAGLAASLNSLAIVARNRGDLARSRAFFMEALELKRELGDLTDISTTTSGMGLLAVDEGKLDEARALLEESLAIDRERGDVVGIAVNLSNLAAVALEQGDLARAKPLLAEGLRAFLEIGDGDDVAECLEETACLLVIQGREETAVRLAGAAAALRETLGMPVSSTADQARLDHHLEHARTALAEEPFEVAYAEGQKLTQDEAAAEGLHEVES